MSLTLSRRIGESVIIGDNIQVRPVKINGDKVRLEIIAPADVEIWREEIWRERLAGTKLRGGSSPGTGTSLESEADGRSIAAA